ncbi:MAG: DUF87 domain-containing protein [Candidatus Bathyarchaeia archaeon]
MEQTPIRVKEHVGIITNETTTTTINFLISPLKNKTTIEKTDYVLIDHPTKPDKAIILAQVTEVKSYEEVPGTTSNEKRAGNLVATAQILGTTDIKQPNRQIQPLLTPPPPGSRVYIPYAEYLEDTLNRDEAGKPYATPIHIADTEATALTTKENKKPVSYNLNAETLVNTHTLITAAAGTGKTHLAKALIAEIANKTSHHIIILDPYGEYKTLTAQTNKPTQTITLQPGEDIKDLAKTAKTKQITIINAEDLTPPQKHAALIQSLNIIWHARLQDTLPPALLVIENAEALKSQTLDTIAQEGTKHRTALILITRSAAELGARILAQTTTQIMGRTITKEDLNALSSIAMEKTSQLPQLKQDQWIIANPDKPQPTQVRTGQE